MAQNKQIDFLNGLHDDRGRPLAGAVVDVFQANTAHNPEHRKLLFTDPTDTTSIDNPFNLGLSGSAQVFTRGPIDLIINHEFLSGALTFNNYENVSAIEPSGSTVILDPLDGGTQQHIIDAIADFSGVPGTVCLANGIWEIGSNLNVPDNIMLKFSYDAKLNKPSAAIIVTIRNIDAPNSNIFLGPSGGYILLAKAKSIEFKQWFEPAELDGVKIPDLESVDIELTGTLTGGNVSGVDLDFTGSIDIGLDLPLKDLANITLVNLNATAPLGRGTLNLQLFDGGLPIPDLVDNLKFTLDGIESPAGPSGIIPFLSEISTPKLITDDIESSTGAAGTVAIGSNMSAIIGTFSTEVVTPTIKALPAGGGTLQLPSSLNINPGDLDVSGTVTATTKLVTPRIEHPSGAGNTIDVVGDVEISAGNLDVSGTATASTELITPKIRPQVALGGTLEVTSDETNYSRANSNITVNSVNNIKLFTFEFISSVAIHTIPTPTLGISSFDKIVGWTLVRVEFFVPPVSQGTYHNDNIANLFYNSVLDEISLASILPTFNSIFKYKLMIWVLNP